MTTITGSVSAVGGRPLQNLSERLADPHELLKRVIDSIFQGLRVAMPAEIVSFDPIKQTVTAQPLIKERVIDRATGDVEFVNLPQLVDIPVYLFGGGGFVLTTPINPGDEALLIFNDLPLDSWWENGGAQNWADRRRHDLSDAVALVGLRSLPNAIPDYSTEATELRTQDGTTRVSVTNGVINLVAATVNIVSGSATMQADSMVIEADDVTFNTTNLNLNGAVSMNNKPYLTHRHSGVQTGEGQTGNVVP